MFDFKVTTAEGDEPFKVTATSRDIALWERTNKGASLSQLNDNMRMTDLYKIAYNACERHGLWHGPLREFEVSVDLEVLDDDDDPGDPTRPAA